MGFDESTGVSEGYCDLIIKVVITVSLLATTFESFVFEMTKQR